ncbi:MAG: N-acetyl-gamma-glutamyl-phosphate reductase [Nitrospinaceae bacterium]|nr:N-acetyl-gamma-glutamyl-phosphate reductase [Nitrospinaceae bacterium]
MAKIGIAGASGYTGLELLRLLINHPEAELAFLTSETYQGQLASEVFPSLGGFTDIKLTPLESVSGSDCDIIFLALPHTTSMGKVPGFLEGPAKIIDLSADYRLKDPAVYEEWYAVKHQHPELLKDAVYGLPEIHREAIKSARLVANPGCYPTSITLALAPLITETWVDLSFIVADSKSGVSGAGRKASLATQFSEVNEGVSAYNIAVHRHTPEIEQELSSLASTDVQVSFSPHLMPMTRGMLSTVYINLKKDVSVEDLAAHFQNFYKEEPFVRVLPPGKFANTHFTVTSNFCDIGVQVDRRNQRAIITSAIDNLIKGASGQAIQNMNLMLGISETSGLNFPGIFP